MAALGYSMRHPIAPLPGEGWCCWGRCMQHRPQRLLMGISCLAMLTMSHSYQLASFSVELPDSGGNDISRISTSRKSRLSSGDSASSCNRSNLSI